MQPLASPVEITSIQLPPDTAAMKITITTQMTRLAKLSASFSVNMFMIQVQLTVASVKTDLNT